MKPKNIQPAFSLTEMLLAIAALAVGMLFIAGAFPVAIHFSTRSTEQSIAAAVADEAFATIKLYAEGNPDSDSDDIKIEKLSPVEMKPFKIIDLPHQIETTIYNYGPYDYTEDINDILPALNIYDPNMPEVFTYPSTNEDFTKKHYYWAPMFRRVGNAGDSQLVQVTIFVCRKPNLNAKFYWPDPNPDPSYPNNRGKVNIAGPVFGPWPEPVKVDLIPAQRINGSIIKNEMLILPSIEELASVPKTRTFINNGSFIVDGKTGQIFRVILRYKPTKTDPTFGRRIKLDRDWYKSLIVSDVVSVWVIPPPSQGGKSPCIGIFQKLIRF